MNDKHGLNAQLRTMFGGNMAQQNPMEDVGRFQEFLKESASEEMVDELFKELYVGNEKEFFKAFVAGFRKYCENP